MIKYVKCSATHNIQESYMPLLQEMTFRQAKAYSQILENIVLL